MKTRRYLWHEIGSNRWYATKPIVGWKHPLTLNGHLRILLCLATDDLLVNNPSPGGGGGGLKGLTGDLVIDIILHLVRIKQVMA